MSPSRLPDWNIAPGRRDPPCQKSRTFSWLVLVDCHNVTIKGLTVDYDPLPFTQGRSKRWMRMARVRRWKSSKETRAYPAPVFRRGRHLHPRACLASQPDPSRAPRRALEMRLETSGHKALVRWVLSWMPDVEALAPQSLHHRVREKLCGRGYHGTAISPRTEA